MKSVLELVRLQQEDAASPGEQVIKGYSDAQYGLPKTWFNDPYALLDSMGLGYRASPSSLSYETLKQMAEKNVIIAAIIQTRLNQVASFCQPQRNKYSIGFKVQHRDPRHKLTASEKEYVHQLERFILNMGAERDIERDSFEVWVRKVTRDRLVFDQLCSEKVLRRNGKPFSVFAVPADTVRIASPRNKRGTPLSKREIDLVPKYVQVIDGTIVNEYVKREFIFRVSNPRTDIRSYGYGLSELELLINTVTSHLWAEEWNRKVFSQGSTIKGILNIRGNVPQQQMESFKRMWLTQVSGVTNAWRTPVMNSEDMQWIPLQPSNNDMGYQQWLEYLIKIACAVYLIDPAEINFDTRAGVGSQPMFMTTNEAQQKVSKDRGLQPLLRFIQNVVNEEIVWALDENFEFLFMGLDARTEAEAIELRMKELQSYKTLNEIRREADELPPVKDGDTVMNPTYVGLKNQLAMQEQQKAMAQQQGGAAGGPPGMPPGMPPGGAPEGAAPPGPPPAAGGQSKELFEGMFSGAGMPTAPDGAGKALGASIKQAGQAPKKKPETHYADEESLSRDEGSDPWEETIHASMRMQRLHRILSSDLSKALDPFKGLE